MSDVSIVCRLASALLVGASDLKNGKETKVRLITSQMHNAIIKKFLRFTFLLLTFYENNGEISL